MQDYLRPRFAEKQHARHPDELESVTQDAPPSPPPGDGQSWADQKERTPEGSAILITPALLTILWAPETIRVPF